ncbi:MAG: hypothetical protein KME55_40975 [Nostoc indistinguendum CM1-VF10]|jgi:hypothetical protein|nr:hypothetical protein [Nostoc indistinguendum CM1-VF10]
MGVVIPELISLRRGQVIGIVTIVDCKFSQVASGWGMPEQYHWKLGNLREITPIPYIGQSQLHHEQLEISIHPDITNYHCHQRQFNIILKISKSRLSRKSR